jgi:hypothetical protein
MATISRTRIVAGGPRVSITVRTDEETDATSRADRKVFTSAVLAASADPSDQ